ncbi:MAG: hypothetical protein GKR94_04620 [Gammaproteobacteria bacterium]|nr:hypothetical protein [Gammaproteobacteria bacterium]
MNRTLVASLLCLVFAPQALANDYPTQARVEYVLSCMTANGGQSYDTLYPCVCSIDKIAQQIKYADYVHAETMSVMITTPGEKGGAFRDAPGARGMVKQFKNVREAAEQSCFVRRAAASTQ